MTLMMKLVDTEIAVITTIHLFKKVQEGLRVLATVIGVKPTEDGCESTRCGSRGGPHSAGGRVENLTS